MIKPSLCSAAIWPPKGRKSWNLHISNRQTVGLLLIYSYIYMWQQFLYLSTYNNVFIMARSILIGYPSEAISLHFWSAALLNILWNIINEARREIRSGNDSTLVLAYCHSQKKLGWLSLFVLLSRNSNVDNYQQRPATHIKQNVLVPEKHKRKWKKMHFLWKGNN